MDYYIRATLLFMIMTLLILFRKRNNFRRYWVRPFLMRRAQFGFFEAHFQFLVEQDEETFYQCTRLTVQQFYVLLDILGDSLDKDSIRTPLSPDFRLFFTLRYLTLIYLNISTYRLKENDFKLFCISLNQK